MNLLIVDDEQIAIDGIMLDMDFESCGIRQVFTANSMAQAQEIFGKHQVDVILCDIEMPNGSGLELMDWLNQQEVRVVKVILTCHSDFFFAQQALRLQCFDYVLKPVMSEELKAVLEKAVKQAARQASDVKIRKFGEEYVNKVAGSQKNELSAVEKARQYIMAHLDEELTVERLAAMVYMSSDYLTRCFHKKYGKTVTEYITEHRMTLAEELLKSTDLSVTMVSAKVGYPNYTYFTKQFKKYSGMTPSKYRERRQK